MPHTKHPEVCVPTRTRRFTRCLTPILLFALAALTSCSKGGDEDDGPSGNRKVSDLVPASYQKTLTDHGMRIHEGNTPPTLSGTYLVNPVRFEYDNHKDPGTYPSPGTVMSYQVRVKFFGQQDNQDIQVEMPGYYTGDEPINGSFITGSGEEFTVCFKARLVGGSGALFAYDYAFVMSGSAEGGVIKNFKLAKVGLDYEPKPEFSVAGEVDLFADPDNLSELIP